MRADALSLASLMVQQVKNLPATQETGDVDSQHSYKQAPYSPNQSKSECNHLNGYLPVVSFFGDSGYLKI